MFLEEDDDGGVLIDYAALHVMFADDLKILSVLMTKNMRSKKGMPMEVVQALFLNQLQDLHDQFGLAIVDEIGELIGYHPVPLGGEMEREFDSIYDLVDQFRRQYFSVLSIMVKLKLNLLRTNDQRIESDLMEFLEEENND